MSRAGGLDRTDSQTGSGLGRFLLCARCRALQRGVCAHLGATGLPQTVSRTMQGQRPRHLPGVAGVGRERHALRARVDRSCVALAGHCRTGSLGTAVSVVGKRNIGGRDREVETALNVQRRRCRDPISLNNPANSGPLSDNRKNRYEVVSRSLSGLVGRLRHRAGRFFGLVRHKIAPSDISWRLHHKRLILLT
jgi:hypothetical protein